MSWLKESSRSSRRTLVVGSLCLSLSPVLTGCGKDDDDSDFTGTGQGNETAVTSNLIDSSPAADFAEGGSRPQDANSATVTIADGNLDPDTIEAQAGLPFILIVEGDGEEHTLAIEDLVSDTSIAAEGATEISLSINEDTTGEFPITLDGEEAGTFVSQAPGGIVED